MTRKGFNLGTVGPNVMIRTVPEEGVPALLADLRSGGAGAVSLVLGHGRRLLAGSDRALGVDLDEGPGDSTVENFAERDSGGDHVALGHHLSQIGRNRSGVRGSKVLHEDFNVLWAHEWMIISGGPIRHRDKSG